MLYERFRFLMERAKPDLREIGQFRAEIGILLNFPISTEIGIVLGFLSLRIPMVRGLDKCFPIAGMSMSLAKDK